MVCYAHAENRHEIRLKKPGDPEIEMREGDRPQPHHDPFINFAHVVRGEIEPDPLSSLENNLIVVEILDAARRSAETGEKVLFD